KAAQAILWIDERQGIGFVLPLLDDEDSTVRWCVCGLMHDFGDKRAVGKLIERLKTDPDPQVRVNAAWALGAIGNAAAIPALIKTMQNDHGVDQLGYSPSSSAKDALEEIRSKQEER